MDPYYYLKETGKNWKYSVLASIIYVTIIFYLRNSMMKKDPMKLRKCLGLWSAFLAIFSIFGTIVTASEFSTIVSSKGAFHSICSQEFKQNRIYMTWLLFFTWSKLFELGDTFFIVLRKQQLIFLHWYHHALTMIYCFWAANNIIGTHRWMMTLNFTVHSFMYTYYSLKACNVNVPKFVAVSITTSQIAQMVCGLFINFYSSYYCPNSSKFDFKVSFVAMLMYLSYFILFTNFFIQTYILKSKVKKI